MKKNHNFKYKIPNTEIELEINCTTEFTKEEPKVMYSGYQTEINSIFLKGVNVLPLFEISNLMDKIYEEADLDGYALFQ